MVPAAVIYHPVHPADLPTHSHLCAVYSRNRHFRLAFCSKGGKDAVLLPTGRYATAETIHRVHILLDTLSCNVHTSAKLLQVSWC